MLLRQTRRYCASLVALILWLQPASGLTISELVFFGDSLTDVGNISTVTFGITPGSGYWNGRFSNGPVYSELVASDLGFGPLTTSLSGGNNFAYGGAQTSGTGGLNGLFIDDVDEQVDDFDQNRTAQPDALFVLLVGANDLFNGQTDVSIPVANIVGDLTQLHAAGARQMLVMNLPRLGNTPEYNSNPSAAAAMNALTDDFNNQLAGALDGLAASFTDTTILEYNLAVLMEHAIANPSLYGLTNVTDPGNAVPNPGGYLFWDNIHPTTAVHAILADQVATKLQNLGMEGDYNDDGNIDVADYSEWLDSIGTTVVIGTGADGNANGLIDQGDYDVWKAGFGASAVGTVVVVPEASTFCMILIVISAFLGFWRGSP